MALSREAFGPVTRYAHEHGCSKNDARAALEREAISTALGEILPLESGHDVFIHSDDLFTSIRISFPEYPLIFNTAADDMTDAWLAAKEKLRADIAEALGVEVPEEKRTWPILHLSFQHDHANRIASIDVTYPRSSGIIKKLGLEKVSIPLPAQLPG